MLSARAILRTVRVAQQAIRPMLSGIESQSSLTQAELLELPTVGSPTSVYSQVFSGNVTVRCAHEDSNQYAINKNKNLGSDADPYGHTPDAVETNSAGMSPPTSEEENGELLNQFDDDSSVRPLGSHAEQNVAADRSSIDPLPDSKKVRSGKIKE